MDLWTLVRIIWRRWLVVLPVLVLTAAAAGLFLFTVQPNYSGYTALVLVSDDPQAAQQGFAADSAGLDAGQLIVAANVVAEVVKGGESQQRVAEAAPRSRYEVNVDPESPILRITATAPAEDVAVAAADAAVDEVVDELERQKGAEGSIVDDRMVADVLARPALGRAVADQAGSEVFVAEASVMMTGDGAGEVRANPFTQLGRSTMTVIAEQSNNEDFVEHLEQRGATAGFTITPDQEAPVLRVVVEGSDESTVSATTEAIFEGLDDRLSARQDELDVPDATRVHLEVLAPPEVDEVPGERMKPLPSSVRSGSRAPSVSPCSSRGSRGAVVARTRMWPHPTTSTSTGTGRASSPPVTAFAPVVLATHRPSAPPARDPCADRRPDAAARG